VKNSETPGSSVGGKGLVQCVTPKCPTFSNKNVEKVGHFGNILVPFLDYNKTKTKKEKSGALWGETLWGHGLYSCPN